MSHSGLLRFTYGDVKLDAASGSALGGAGSARTADDLRRARLERFSAAPSRDADAELNAAADEALRNAGIES